jgi:hypothetical protein
MVALFRNSGETDNEDSCSCRGRTKDPLLCPYSNMTPPPLYPSYEMDGLSYYTAAPYQCNGHVLIDQSVTQKTSSTDSSEDGKAISGPLTSSWEVVPPKSVEACCDDLSVCELSNCMPGQCIAVSGQLATASGLSQRYSTSTHQSNTGTGQINSPSRATLNNSVK